MEAENDLASARLPRRPVPTYYNHDARIDVSKLSLEPPPRPPHLRPSRSATNLDTAGCRHHAELLRPQVVDTRSCLPVGFITEDVPSPDPDQALRRVKSSSALSTSALDGTGESSAPSSKWKSALGSAQYFAGGLVTHPFTSTRHLSIIRHSHALIWYRGPSTCISITILSDEPLPGTRTVWMQQKGFSGNVGMTLKALAGTTGSWLDVTPARRAGVENVPEADERGVQRDLKRFAKKATGRQKKHVPRETHVVRVPAAATDGYFRLVLCAGDEPGKKVLCSSPVFRVASTSTDLGVLRGASLSSMPLEVGVKVASTIGQTMAKKYTGVAGAVVQGRATKLVTNATAKKIGHAAYQQYHSSGLGDAVSQSWQRSMAARGSSSDPPMAMLDTPASSSIIIIGSDAGPEAPFPVKLDGKVVRGTGKSTAELGIPTANLSGVSETIKARMSGGGVFIAWACIHAAGNAGQDDIISPDWHEAIVTIAPLRNAPPAVAMKNSVVVHFILHDFDEDCAPFVDARVKVLLMGYLHPAAGPAAEPEELVGEHARDVVVTLASLGREAWTPQETVDRMKGLKGERSFSDMLDGATGKVVQQVDRIPLHWAGVRSESGGMQDKVYGNGGLWIAR